MNASSDDNPYKAPSVEVSAADHPADRTHLRQIARAQRHVKFVVWLYLCFLPFGDALSMFAAHAWARYALVLSTACVIIVGAISVYRLAALFRGNVIAIIYAVGSLVPCLGLILLLVVIEKATKYLQEHGIKVGLLGVDPESIS